MRLHPDHPALQTRTKRPASLVDLAAKENAANKKQVDAEIARQNRAYAALMHQRRMDALREHGDRVLFEPIGDRSIGT